MYNVNLKVTDFLGRQLCHFYFNLTSRLGSALWERNFLLNFLEEKIFPLGVETTLEGFCLTERKTGSHKVIPLFENGRKICVVPMYLKYTYQLVNSDVCLRKLASDI